MSMCKPDITKPVVALLAVFLAVNVVAAPLDTALPRTLGKLRAGEPVTVIGFGDSITTYVGGDWVHPYPGVFPELMYYGVFARHLESRFPEADITVINAGVGGNTTVSALARLERDVIAKNPDLVFVVLGANDSGFLSLAEYEANLRTIVSRIKETGSDVVVLGSTLNPIDPTVILGNNAVALRVAAELNVPGVDGFPALSPLAAGGREGLRVTSLDDFCRYIGGLFPPNDPIHPNYLGHFQLGRLLFHTLEGRPMPKPPKSTLRRRFAFGVVSEAPSTAGAAHPLQGVRSPPCTSVATEYELTLTPNGNALPAGRLLVLGLPQWEVPGTQVQELPLGNGLDARVRVLAEQKVSGTPGESMRVTWKLPSLPAVPPEGSWRILDPNRTAVVLLWLTDAGPTFLDYAMVEPQPGQPRLGAIMWGTSEDRSSHLNEPKLPVQVTITDADKRKLAARLAWNGRAWTAPVDADGKAELAIEFGELAATRHDLATLSLVDTENGATPLDMRRFIVQLSATIAPESSAAPSRWFDIHAAGHEPAVVARLGAVADDTHLRLVWQVQDAHLVALEGGFHTDGVELYFARNGKTFQVGAFLPEGLREGAARLAPGVGAKAEELAEWGAAWKRLPTGYELSVTIPKALIADWTHDGLLPFSCAVNSLDTPDNPRHTRRQWQWLGRNSNYWNPTRYGAIRLHGEPRQEWDANVFP
jgi:lysophospholipase L1-like esterase